MECGLACPVCGQLNPLRSQACGRCGNPLAPAPMAPGVAPAARAAAPAPAMPAADPSAQAAAPRFDPATGQPIAAGGAPAPAAPAGGAKTMFFGALQQEAATPRLVVIKGDGTGDGDTYHLTGTTHVAGRSEGDIAFGDDIFLSPSHAKFTVQAGRLFVQDMNSANGIFVRIKQPVLLGHGEHFLVGEQLLSVDLRPLPEYAPSGDGTYFYGSPRPEASFWVEQLLAGGGEGRLMPAQGQALTIGREGNSMNFPTDRFISGRHARLDLSGDTSSGQAKVQLTDTGSRNGTFIRISGAFELHHGDYLFVGQQLFRVEIS